MAGLPVFGGLDSHRARDREDRRPDPAHHRLQRAPAGRAGASWTPPPSCTLDVRTVPSMVELLDGTVDAYRVRGPRGGPPPAPDRHGARRRGRLPSSAGKTVLITGAGGSIGSELAPPDHELAPAEIRLILVDRAENALFDIHRQLSRRRPLHAPGGGHRRASST